MMNGGDDADDDPRRTHLRLSQEAALPSENWDDDFEFQPRSIDQTRDGEYDATDALGRPAPEQEQEESWDDAYADEDPDASPIKQAPKVDDQDVEDWDSSDNEAHSEHEREYGHIFNTEPTRRFGAGFEEEDKTVTARSRSSRAHSPPPALPVPTFSTHAQHLQYPSLSSLPFQPPQLPSHHPLPSTSPTLSSFSIPVSSNRASIYSQDPLMPSTSNSSAPHLFLSTMRAYPQSAGSTPPRKGRRLRKKSRPPEADIFELEDREPDPLPAPDSPVPPPVLPSPPRPVTPPTMNTPAAPPTPSPSLLTRIGSIKRWARRSLGPDDPALAGFRRGKSSTGPSEISRIGKSSTGPEELAFADESLEQDPRTVSPTPAPGKAKLRRSRGDSASGQKSGWFFRAGGSRGTEKDEMSASASVLVPAPVPARTPEPSPSKRSNGVLRRWDKETEGNGGTPTPKKPKGQPVPALRTDGSVSQAQTHPEQTSPAKACRDRAQRHQAPRPISQTQPQPSLSMQFPRHHGSASVGRSAGAPLSVVVSNAGMPPHEENDAAEVREREGGMRSLMNGVRRLSLVSGVHKRTKSTGGDQAAVEVARKGERTEDVRPRSRIERRPVSRASTTGGELRPVSRASTTGMGAWHEAENKAQTLLPPVELDSPSSPQFARRGSKPWTDYDPVGGVSAGYSSVSGDVPLHSTGAGLSAPSYLPPPVSFSASRQQRAERQPFSTSTTSLNSPTRIAIALAPPPQTPTTPQRSETPPFPGPAPNLQGTALATPPRRSPRPGSASAIPPAPQSASLGRSTASPAHAGSGLRRNSLGDLKIQTPPRGELKIPARISRAQQGLRRDLGMVREFAACVEQLKRLQGTYTSLISELRAAYDASPISSASRPISPAQVQFHLPSRPSSQFSTNIKAVIANPNPSLQSVHEAASPSSPVLLHSRISSRQSDDVGRELVRLEHEYGIWWECAELLVELGGGSVAGTVSNPNLAAHSGSGLSTPAGAPLTELVVVADPVRGTAPGLHVASMSEPGSIFGHALVEASTSKGPPKASPPHPSQWRASTGRHDLSARQLRLLKDMLNTPDPASLAYAAGPYGYGAGYPPSYPYQYAVQEGGDAQPWAPWNPSTATLQSEESSTDPHLSAASYGRFAGESMGRSEGKEKKRRASRLGMLGIREILRGLKRNAMAEGKLDRAAYDHKETGSESSVSASNSAEDDHYNRRHSPWHQHDEHHASKYHAASQGESTLGVPPIRTVPPKSPRRPSLASIFRLGQWSSRNGSKSKEQSSSGNGNSTTDDEREAGPGVVAMGEYSDWDRMSRSDLDLTTTAYGSGTATVRGKKLPLPSSGSYSNLLHSHSHPNANILTPQRTPTASRTSLRETSPTPPWPPNLPLSIVEEDKNALHHHKPKIPGPGRLKKVHAPSWSKANSPVRPPSSNGKAPITGTVRSAPPTDISSMPDPKLALTPENIKPLLEYAKEVGVRLGECIGEVQTLLSTTSSAKAG